MGKEDWWWIFDDSLKEIARQLLIQDFVVLDGFVPDELHMQIKRELKVMYDSGSMRIGLLAGGRTGTNMKYAMGSVRGPKTRCVPCVSYCGREHAQACCLTFR